MSEQFLQNMIVLVLIGVIAVVLEQPLAIMGLLLLQNLPQLSYEDIQAVGNMEGEETIYDDSTMGFLANIDKSNK